MILCYIMVYILPKCAQEFCFLHILTTVCYHLPFYSCHSNKWEVISHCGFDSHFPDDESCVHIDHPFFFSWEKCLFRSFAHYLTEFFFLFFSCVVCVVCMYVFFLCFRNWPLIRYAICKYFLPFSRLLISFHFVDDFLWDPLVAQSVKILPAM